MIVGKLRAIVAALEVFWSSFEAWKETKSKKKEKYGACRKNWYQWEEISVIEYCAGSSVLKSMYIDVYWSRRYCESSIFRFYFAISWSYFGINLSNLESVPFISNRVSFCFTLFFICSIEAGSDTSVICFVYSSSASSTGIVPVGRNIRFAVSSLYFFSFFGLDHGHRFLCLLNRKVS